VEFIPHERRFFRQWTHLRGLLVRNEFHTTEPPDRGQAMTDEAIRREGLDALRDRLGKTGMIRFLQQFATGRAPVAVVKANCEFVGQLKPMPYEWDDSDEQ
jgi:hypothetical protein